MSRNFTKKELEQLLTDGWRPDEDYVFVSYASADWAKVYPTVLALRAKGINVYIDVEFREVQSQNWLENFKHRLLDDPFCQGIVTFLSISYMRSYACLMEQLANRTKELYSAARRFHPVFYSALEPQMGSVQSIESYLVACRKESAREEVTVTPVEYAVLQDFIADMHRDYGTYSTDDAAKIVKKLKNKHSVAITMFELILQDNTPSIQSFDGPTECAELLYRNFVGEKNTTIELEALEELKAETLQKLREAGCDLGGGPEPVPDDVPDTRQQKDSGGGTVSAGSADAQGEPDGNEGRKAKRYTATGDITFTLYGEEYTYNQSDMMLTFFAQVLNRHQEYVEGLPGQKGMNCASAVDYTKKENRTEEMPSYFRVCQYFAFGSGRGVCIGTAFGVNDKLKKMAALLDICGEDPSVFSSEQVALPETGKRKKSNLKYF